MDIIRLLELPDEEGQSVFLWGPRKTGKSTWIKDQLKDHILIDLLSSEAFYDYSTQPQLLRERAEVWLQRNPTWIVIDEVQRVPDLLNEVHWLIENRRARFLLTGSSARKLRKGQANLLGGRAWRREMRPLSLAEVLDREWDLEKMIFSGLLPSHFLSKMPQEHLRAYVSDYLKEEIAAEALTRNLPAFGEFLRVSALGNGEILNLENFAREVAVSARAISNYFDILQDTLIGERLPAWTKSQNRRLIKSDKFYYFDVGVANFLARRKPKAGTPEFGKSFEHLVWMELRAYQAYREPDLPLGYWRSASGFEVDFLMGDKQLAVEVKSGRVHESDLKGLSALGDDSAVARRIVVSLDTDARILQDRHGEVTVLPLRQFVEKLWAGELI